MKLTAKEIAIFGIFAAIMYVQQVALSFIPNVHLTGVIIIMLTVLYRWKALYPVMTYVLLNGALNGFALWWIPYLYIWPLLVVVVVGVTDVIWKNSERTHRLPNQKIFPIIWMCINALHGFLYGTLYALSYGFIMQMGVSGTIAWIISGLPFDVIHGISNFILGSLILPLGQLTMKCTNYGNHD